jgi:hypothetical protein
MSYDIDLCDPVTGDVLVLEAPHQMKGGTYAVGGSSEASLNITYNYAPIFVDVFGYKGIRWIYGKTAAETIQDLQEGADCLADDAGDDYWRATEGNAKLAIFQILALARLRPDGVWRGD